MSLFLATFLTGIVLLALGGWFLWNGPRVRPATFGWMRSTPAAVVLFGGAAVWFLWHIAHLGKADFGDYKQLLLLVFGVTALGSFFFVRDFLAVRGLAVLMLLSARPLLDAAYMQFDHPQRLLMVIAVYIGIVIALIIGAAPYRLRNFFTWLFAKNARVRALGLVLVVYGAAVFITSFTY
ncbi:hypothetical protein H5P28_14745 [Ruficoccus amylovorans]|uniref:Uncharacterized protein n=2 Tax=Ruficoccus amylovorans TaxID=1804625 RepID=A0A842HGH7_9BACT|nr:hypothetical protein [Ruficoccus amylovorans]